MANTIANQPSEHRELTRDEWAVVELYRTTFNEPSRPTLDYGHCRVEETQILGWARQGLAQGYPIKWEELFAPLAPGTRS
jgi:hypothetical protein